MTDTLALSEGDTTIAQIQEAASEAASEVVEGEETMTAADGVDGMRIMTVTVTVFETAAETETGVLEERDAVGLEVLPVDMEEPVLQQLVGVT